MSKTKNFTRIEQLLSDFITPVYPVSPDTINRLTQITHLQKVSKNDDVCVENEIFNKVMWVTKGIFRVSRIMHDEDQTIAFGIKGDPFLSPDSYLYDKPSQLSFNPVTDSEYIYVYINDFKKVVESTELVMWFNKVLLRQIIALENKYIWLGEQNAKDRYLRLIKLRPEIAARVPLKHIASYLGVTQSYLSRVRATIAGKTEE